MQQTSSTIWNTFYLKYRQYSVEAVLETVLIVLHFDIHTGVFLF